MCGNLTAQVRNIANRHHGGRARRPLAQDHGRRPRRNSGAQGHHQHDGRSAQLVRSEVTRVAREVGTKASSADKPRSRRCRHLEGPHRQRQLHGVKPHRPGPQYRDVPPRSRVATFQKITVNVSGESLSEGNAQHNGRPAQCVCRRKSRASHVKSDRRPVGRPGQRARVAGT